MAASTTRGETFSWLAVPDPVASASSAGGNTFSATSRSSRTSRPVDHTYPAAPEERGDQLLLQLPADHRVSVWDLLYGISFCSA